MTNRQTINFRVWDTVKKEFTYEFPKICFDHKQDAFSFLGKNIIICLFTGLIDRNGKEIYEGDVVSLEIPLNDQPIFVNATIVWDYYQYAFEIHSSENTVLPIEDWFMLGDEPSVDCTVIGNIFES